MKKKKVLILFNHFQVQDGVARTAIGLANELAKRPDLEVTMQSLFLFDVGMKNWLDSRVQVKKTLGFYFRGLVRLVDLVPDKWLYRWTVREHYDVEIGFCMALPIQIIAASENREAQHYAWIHGYDTGLTLLDSYQKMDRVFSVSRCNVERFAMETGGEIPVCCCYNLVDDKKVQTMGAQTSPVEKTDVPTFVAVGRLEPGKGIMRLIECFGQLKREGYDFQLWLVGDGGERKSLENRAAELGIEEKVLFLGAQSNPHAITSRADVLVCASYSEGYSTVCVEAIQLGVPVLTTEVSGAREIIDDAQAGMVVGQEDQELYAGLKSILDDPEQLTRWRQTLEKTKDVFSYANRAAEMAKVLDI